MFIFLITIILGMNDRALKNISGEEIPRIQHYLVNEFDELSGLSSYRRKPQWGTPGTFT